MTFPRVWLIVGAISCGYPEPDTRTVGGTVNGLWDGAGGVTLRLRSDGVDLVLTATTGGPFRFPQRLDPGATYTVTVDQNPADHVCLVDRGTAIVGDADIADVAITCTGPEVSVSFVTPHTLAFDHRLDENVYPLSLLTQQIGVQVTGPTLTAASIGSVDALGQPPMTIPLLVGDNDVVVTVRAPGGAAELTKRYTLKLQRNAPLLTQSAYLKASNPVTELRFGQVVAVSGDTVAIGAIAESSKSTGVNGVQTDRTANFAGAVYVFVRTGDTWQQQAYIKASNTDPIDRFGRSIALFGNTLVVGADGEDSAATGVNSMAQGDNTLPDAGAVYVFERTGTTWAQRAYLKAPNSGVDDRFGTSVAVSADRIVVGANGEASNGTGQPDNSTPNAGAIYVFRRSGSSWVQEAYIKAPNPGQGDFFGESVALSDDTIVVGAPAEDGSGNGVDPPDDNAAPDAGAAYVFRRVGVAWTPEAVLKASNSDFQDRFGHSVALAGNDIAVGAPEEDGSGRGVNPADPAQATNSLDRAGAVYLFHRTGTTWLQEAYLKAPNSQDDAHFGDGVALVGDVLAIGSSGEDGADPGFRPNADTERGTNNAGAIYLFHHAAGWTASGYVKTSNPEGNDFFADRIGLSTDFLIGGATEESSNATGFNGNQLDNSLIHAGASYVFR